MFNGGYIMLDLRESSEKVLKQASICANQDKPVLVYDANGKGTFMTIASDGADGYILTGSNATVAIASDGTVTLYSGVLMENIKDKSGNLRFIDADGTPSTKITNPYCKWSLSGSHIMFVIAGTLENTTDLINGETFTEFNIPEWIYNKIYPVWQNSWIETKTVIAHADDWTTQNVSVGLSKFTTPGIIRILNTGNLTLTADRHFRIQFDLLIDND